MTFIWIMTAKRFRNILRWSRIGHLFEEKLRDEEQVM